MMPGQRSIESQPRVRSRGGRPRAALQLLELASRSRAVTALRHSFETVIVACNL